ELPAALRERIAGYPAALVCPLGVAPPEAEGAGLLLVAADRKLLAAVEDSVEVLAAQAALALDRIVLTEQIHRRDSDHYLRTITRNSVDMVLIVDDDLGIRYASASVASMFGLDLPLPTNLQDLARAGGAEQITRTLTTARRAPQADGVRDWWRLQRADGSTLTLEVNCRDLRQDRTVRGYVLTMRDSTQDDAHQRDVLQQALANRLR
ncbi:MAG TPA: PAS domain S-box protein, partial [Rugosimonospora sp.]|nr:PAS domain S-box protein [Rugosimonospora sp.]